MSAKEDLLKSLSDNDKSGGVDKIHKTLVDSGLKFKGPRNSNTLLYYYRHGNSEIGVAAMRDSPTTLLSLPKNFWENNKKLEVAIKKAHTYHISPTGPISSSQYSSAQFQITATSINTLISIINEIIIPEALAAGAKLQNTAPSLIRGSTLSNNLRPK